MSTSARHDAWSAGDAYESYMGRWSRPVAERFLDWLAMPGGLEWLELGCGTGALTAAIVGRCDPARIFSMDPSEAFVNAARRSLEDPRVDFQVGDAAGLATLPARGRDVAVSGLVLNFVPDRAAALQQMRRIVRPGGTVAFYVWDYAGRGVGFMRAFWSAAIALDPAAADLAEDRRFPFCTREGLGVLARDAGLAEVEAVPIEAPSVFADFDDLWRPFTLGAGPAPGYCASLADDARETLRQRLSDSLDRQGDGSIALSVRAWAVRGRVT